MIRYKDYDTVRNEIERRRGYGRASEGQRFEG